MPTERLTLKAIAEDEFSDVLNELENQLISIAALKRKVFPIEAEVEGVATAIGKLETLEETINRIDDDLDILSGGGTHPNFVQELLGTDGSVSVSSGGGTDTGDGVATSGGQNIVGPDIGNTVASGIPAEGISGGMVDLVQSQNSASNAIPDNTPSDSLTKQFRDLQFVMGDFFKVLAALIPLLGTFVGALPAAIAGLGALAGAALAAAGGLAAIGGLGLLGMAMGNSGLSFKRLKRRITSLFETFQEAFGPLMNEFAPAMEGAFRDLQYLIRDLARYGTVLLGLTDTFKQLSHLLSRNLAPVLADIVSFGEAAIPIFSALAARFPDVNVMSVFADILVQTLPLIVAIATEIGRLLPIIFEMSTGFLAAAFGITQVFGALTWAINLLPYGIKLFGIFAGVMMSLVTVSALYTVISDSLDSGLLRLLPAIWKNIQAWRMMTWSEIKATLASISLGSALMWVMGIITFGIAPAVAALSSGFGLLNNNIRDATNSLRNFNGVASDTPGLGGMGPSGAGGSGGSGSATYNKFTVDVNSREHANRMQESLSYMEGTRRDGRLS